MKKFSPSDFYSKLSGYEKKDLKLYDVEQLRAIAKKYGIIRYSRLKKEDLINIIKINPDYIEANPKFPRRVGGDNKRGTSNLLNLKESLMGTETAEEIMNEILSRLSGSERPLPPIPGKFYTYIYYAKTPNIIYDQHPLILAGETLPRGFMGFNYHLGKPRQYNTQDGERLVSGLYEVSRLELSILLRISYGKLVHN